MNIKKILLFLALSNEAFANECLKNKYVFDFGSGSLKASGYQVNVCKNTIKRYLPKYNKVVNIQTCALKSKDGKSLKDECIIKGIKAIDELKQLYNTNCESDECLGIATAWARNIKNSDEVFNQFLRETNIYFSVISQEKEGILALEAAKMHLPAQGIKVDQNTIIFDSGGGSFQLSGFKKKNQYFVFKGKQGSATILHELSTIFNNGNYKLIAKKDIKNAIAYVDQIVAKEIIKDYNLSNLINNNKLKIYSFSGFVQYGIKRNLRFKSNVITIKDLERMITESTQNTLSEMKKKYPGYLIDNQAGLLLVYSVMRALKVNEFTHISKDIKDYLSLNPSSVIY